MFEREHISACDRLYRHSCAHINHEDLYQFSEIRNHPDAYLSKTTNPRLTHTTSDVYIYIYIYIYNHIYNYMYTCICILIESTPHKNPYALKGDPRLCIRYANVYIYVYTHIYIYTHLHMLYIQSIADRVAQNLEITCKTFSTNQNSVHGIYD